METNPSLRKGFLCLFILGWWTLVGWRAPDWSQGAMIPEGGRSNPYEYSDIELESVIREGRLHALNYPVEPTGILMPLEATRQFLEDWKGGNPLRDLLKLIFKGLYRFRSLDDVQKWLGLATYPNVEGEGVYHVPFLDKTRPEFRMGFTVMEKHHTEGFTISCAQCHSSDLFGKKVIGLTNRFSRANAFFQQGQKAMKMATPARFQWATMASDEDMQLYREAHHNIRFIGIKKPQTLGLDTSLAQVALSLSRRSPDAYASKEDHWAKNPRKNPLDEQPADSKPMVWWNLKYKNRWLADGSVISGNPILTNFLWNEIGRGTDLQELERWMDENKSVIRELTTAVFATEAPRFTDFFVWSEEDLMSAKRGEKIFLRTCARCHGIYQKAWALPEANAWSLPEQIATTKVIYSAATPVIDVGTDPLRYEGMQALTPLNDLAISRNNGIWIEPQKGYLPPPLVGIWARWPYFHNNSVPTLCDVLKPQEDRPAAYWSGPAKDKERDFDRDCNGYPTGESVPSEWKQDMAHKYVTGRKGLNNTGHDLGIFIREGENILDENSRRDLVRFLQTL